MCFKYQLEWILCFCFLLVISNAGCTQKAKDRQNAPEKSIVSQQDGKCLSSVSKEVAAVIAEAPVVIEKQGGDIGEYKENVISALTKITNKNERVNGFKALAKSVCSIDFGSIGKTVGGEQGLDEETRKRRVNIRLSNAQSTLVKFTDEIWTRLYIEDVSGDDLFEPWFVLLEALKRESIRRGHDDVVLFEKRVDHVERLFNLFYLEGRNHKPTAEEIEKIERRFMQLVGRPIRNREEYLRGEKSHVEGKQ